MFVNFISYPYLRGREGMRIEPIVTRDIFLRLCPKESDPFRYANCADNLFLPESPRGTYMTRNKTDAYSLFVYLLDLSEARISNRM